jgi:hypothetical protein
MGRFFIGFAVGIAGGFALAVYLSKRANTVPPGPEGGGGGPSPGLGVRGGVGLHGGTAQA